MDQFTIHDYGDWLSFTIRNKDRNATFMVDTDIDALLTLAKQINELRTTGSYSTIYYMIHESSKN